MFHPLKPKQTLYSRCLSGFSRLSRFPSHLPSIFATLRTVLLLVALTGVFLYTRVSAPTHVAAAVPATLNFQARLLTGAGSIVPDGIYNVEFKLYNTSTSTGSSQGSCTGDATCLWTETRLTTDAANLQVSVKSGYLSVYLGDKTALPSNIWDQQLYLTMNVGGTPATPTWDGQMTPRLRLTSVPYAFQAAKAAQLQQIAGANTGTLSFGTLTTNPTIALPDASGTVALLQNAQTFTGAITFNAGLNVANNSNFLQSGTGTFGTGTGAVSLNGATSVSGTNTFTVVSGATSLGGTLAVTGAATFSNNLIVNGSQFTNNGSTLNTAQAIANLLTGGNIGAAATTVDVDTTFTISQTTAGQTLSLPSPTTTTSGRIVYVANTGTTAFTMHGVTIVSGNAQTYIWNGSAWTATNVDGAGSGVTSVGTLDSLAKTANGAGVTGNQLILQTADATNPGLVSTGTQTFAGAKTFGGTLAVTGTSTFTGLGTFNGGLTVANNSNFSQTGTGTFSTGTGAVSINGDTTLAAGKNLTLTGGKASQNGYNLATAGENNLLVNGDFEYNNTTGWSGITTTTTGGYAGNYTSQTTGGSTILSDDYVPVDPVRDVLQLEGYFKKTVTGSPTPGVLYFGYIAYDANKAAITTAPCGTYCYFAASNATIPADSAWHKYSATTTGEGTVYPNLPVGTKYVRVLALINYGASANEVTQMDHVTLKRVNNGPLFVGNNFSTTNLVDQQQQSRIYTNSSSSLILDAGANGTNLVTVTNGGALTALGLNSGTGLIQGTGGLTITGTSSLAAINASGAYTQSGAGANTFTGVTSFTAAGTALTVGARDATNTYSYFDGLRVSGDDTLNSLYNGTKSIVISADSGTTISLCATSDCTKGINLQTSTGNIGVGTSSPISSLQTNGTLTVGPGATANTIGVAQITTGGTSPISNRLTYGTDGTGWKFAIGKNQGGVVTDQFTIQDNGNVGIGTTSPGRKLEVAGDIQLTGTAAVFGPASTYYTNYTANGSNLYSTAFNRSSGTSYITPDIYGGSNGLVIGGLVGGTGTIALNTTGGATPTVYLNSAGNVGIGTTIPGQKLEVAGNVAVYAGLPKSDTPIRVL